MQLCYRLHRVWASKAAASRLEKCGTAVAVLEGKAHKLESAEEIMGISRSIKIIAVLPGQALC